MKNWILWIVGPGLVMLGVVVAGGAELEAPAQTNAVGIDAWADPSLAAEVTPEETELANAVAQPISTNKALPTNLKLSGPATEITKLAQSGVAESVMLAFVTNSTSAFNLGVDEIIYLNDIGVPGDVVAAMMQRDKVLKELASSQPGLYAPQPAEAPVPPEMPPEPAPQPEGEAASYPPPVAEEAGYPVFYDELAPYGNWVNVAGCGPCWQPTVVVINPTWRPYCDSGHWIYSDCGWYWFSGYSWGWAPFHYGRWFQHNRLGWCWRPDTVWGPSWVCWRYSGTHYGWAPLPPRAGFRAGLGLTYRGHGVGNNFGFGLGARSFTFVETSHFRDRHLNRQALPPRQASRIYHETAASTTILESNHRVINHGIPPTHVAAATHRDVHTVAIQHVDGAGARGSRHEQFEGNSRTLSVSRPDFHAPTGTMPGSGGKPRSERRGGGTSPALVPTTHRVMPESLPRTPAASVVSQPRPATPSISTPQGPTSFFQRPTTPRTGSGAVGSSPGRAIAPRQAQPLVLHGPDRPSQPAIGSTIDSATRRSPSHTTSTTTRRDTAQRLTASVLSTTTAQTPRIAPTHTPQSTFSRPAASQSSQPHAVSATPAPARSESHSSPVRVAPPAARAETQWRHAAPSYSPPAQVTHSTPSPSPAPQHNHSFSPPSVSSAPQTRAVESHSTHYSAPAPAASSSASQSHSSSDRRGR